MACCIYGRRPPGDLRPRRPSRRPSGLGRLFSFKPKLKSWRRRLLQPSPDVSHPHWTVPVTREETLAIREKFRRAGWRKPNHKPSTTKVIARAKNLWNRHCVYIGVDPEQDLLESGPADFETWIDWIHRATKKKTHKTIVQLWKWLCQSYSVLAKKPMDVFTTDEKVLGVEHPDTLTSINNLATVLGDQGKYEATKEMYRRALGRREKVLGVDHPHTNDRMLSSLLARSRECV